MADPKGGKGAPAKGGKGAAPKDVKKDSKAVPTEKISRGAPTYQTASADSLGVPQGLHPAHAYALRRNRTAEVD